MDWLNFIKKIDINNGATCIGVLGYNLHKGVNFSPLNEKVVLADWFGTLDWLISQNQLRTPPHLSATFSLYESL